MGGIKMYKIALLCEHGASTGLCVRKMIEASEKLGIESEIGAYSILNIKDHLETKDWLLLGPQLSYKLDSLKAEYPECASKLSTVSPVDFGMMDGEKILKDVIELINKKEQ